jgi:hypothetical protein
MNHHHLVASSTLLLLTLSACGSVAEPEDSDCHSGDLTHAIFFPTTNHALPSSHLDAVCLAARPRIDASGRADCVVIVARQATSTSACNQSDGLVPVSTEHAWAMEHLVPGADPGANSWSSFCEIEQLAPASAGAEGCRDGESATVFDESGNPARGFCFVDGTTSSSVGAASVLARCPDSEQQILRFTESVETHDTDEDKSVIVVCSTQECAAE